jgi:hypothetical protein
MKLDRMEDIGGCRIVVANKQMVYDVRDAIVDGRTSNTLRRQRDNGVFDHITGEQIDGDLRAGGTDAEIAACARYSGNETCRARRHWRPERHSADRARRHLRRLLPYSPSQTPCEGFFVVRLNPPNVKACITRL